mmetsp:Transcript_22897/g.68049  ORF Transcript_22897/g.68049 Transcript_22897/m.68049 type:complete len:205 (-) Transcript_22897:1002-1616(-)
MAEHEVQVVCTLRDDERHDRVLYAHVQQHTTAVPRIQQAVGKDNVGAHADVFATPLLGCPHRPRCDVPLLLASSRGRFWVPRILPKHVGLAVLAEDLEHFGAVLVAPKVIHFRRLRVDVGSPVKAREVARMVVEKRRRIDHAAHQLVLRHVVPPQPLARCTHWKCRQRSHAVDDVARGVWEVAHGHHVPCRSHPVAQPQGVIGA